MRKKVVLLATLLVGGTFMAKSQVTNPPNDTHLKDYFKSYFEEFNVTSVDSGLEKKIHRLEKELLPRVYPHGKLSELGKSYFEYYLEHENDVIVAKGSKGNSSLKALSSGTWESIGPVGNPTGWGGVGRMDGVYFDPLYNIDNYKVYGISPYGGLWESENSGDTWEIVESSDFLPTSSLGSMAIDQNNGENLFVSTGHSNDISFRGVGPHAGFQNVALTAGIYRSQNGGGSWQSINSGLMNHFTEGGSIRKLLINPSNGNELYAATSLGIFKTTNALAATPTWSKIFDGLNSTLDYEFKGLEFKPGNNSTVYASGFDIYKSTNSGSSWQSMTGPGTGLDYSQLGANFTPVRINIAVTPANENLLYAYIFGRSDNAVNPEDKDNKIFIFKFDGTTWTQLHSLVNPTAWNAITSSRLGIAVSPIDEDFVVYGTTVIWTNQSGSFGQVSPYLSSGHHADVQHIVFEPNSVTPRVWEAHDGGISFSETPLSNNKWRMKNNGLCNATIWTFDHSHQNENYILIGNQDNGVTRASINDGSWTHLAGGDGYAAQISDREDDFALYLSNSSLVNFNVYTNASRYETSFKPYDIVETNTKVGAPANFPMVNDPNTGEEYVGFTNVYKRLKKIASGSPDETWQIESDISKYPRDPHDYPAQWTRQIQEMEIPENDPDYVYISTIGIDDLGYSSNPAGVSTFSLNPGFFRSSQGFSDGDYSEDVFVDLSDKLPQTTKFEIDHPVISGIAADPENGKRVWVSFMNTEPQLKVWYSQDAGENWKNADPHGTLPNIPITAIEYMKGSKDMLVVGTDAGIYYKEEGSDEWTHDSDFPNVRITEIRANYVFEKLRVATFGRGIWELDIESLTTSDLYMKDNPDDSGLEGNDSEPEGRMWISEDIWIRNENDQGAEHQNPKYYVTRPNYIYVKIRNRGTEATAGGEKLEIYYNKARTDSEWPDSWDGTNTTGPNNVPTGGKIDEITLPSIPGCGEFVAEIEWRVPDPLTYDALERDHFCILARIEEPTKPNNGFFVPETECTWCNLYNNNNVVSKNVTVIGSSDEPQGLILPGGGTGTVTVGNLSPTPKCTKLGFEVPQKELSKPVTDFGTVKARLTDELYDDWMNQGGISSGVTVGLELTTVTRIVQNLFGKYIEIEIPKLVRTLKIESPKAYIQLEMPAQKEYDITMNFRQDLLKTLEPAKVFEYDLKHYDCSGGSDVIDGGENYIINNYQQTLGDILSSQTQNDQDVVVSPFVDPSDAANIDMATLIEEYENSLKDASFTISPNPTSDNLTITLEGFSFGRDHQILVYDLKGKLLINNSVSEIKTLNISDLPNGAYTVVLVDKLSNKQSSKLITKK